MLQTRKGLMPAMYDPRVIARARVLWTEEGLSPGQMVGKFVNGERVGSQLEVDQIDGTLPQKLTSH